MAKTRIAGHEAWRKTRTAGHGALVTGGGSFGSIRREGGSSATALD